MCLSLAVNARDADAQSVPAPRSTLVIGGTGMLLGTLRHLLGAGDDVCSVSRRPPALTHPRLHPLLVDYRDPVALGLALDRSGPFQRALVWVHSVAPDVPERAALHVSDDFFHVLGSAAADPAAPAPDRRERFEALGVRYHEIVLGFMTEQGHSRWLTNAEISEGVWGAVQRPQPRCVVGTVEPWNARP